MSSTDNTLYLAAKCKEYLVRYNHGTELCTMPTIKDSRPKNTALAGILQLTMASAEYKIQNLVCANIQHQQFRKLWHTEMHADQNCLQCKCIQNKAYHPASPCIVAITMVKCVVRQ